MGSSCRYLTSRTTKYSQIRCAMTREIILQVILSYSCPPGHTVNHTSDRLTESLQCLEERRICLRRERNQAERETMRHSRSSASLIPGFFLLCLCVCLCVSTPVEKKLVLFITPAWRGTRGSGSRVWSCI